MRFEKESISFEEIQLLISSGEMIFKSGFAISDTGPILEICRIGTYRCTNTQYVEVC